MVAVEVAKAPAVVAVAGEGPIRAEAEAKVEVEVDAAEEEREYKSDMRKLEELMSKLNPCAQEFVPSSRSRRAAPATAQGAGLSADAPVFVSAAEFFGGAAGQLQVGGGRDSSSDGSSNGGGQPQNRRFAFMTAGESGDFAPYGSLICGVMIGMGSLGFRGSQAMVIMN